MIINQAPRFQIPWMDYTHAHHLAPRHSYPTHSMTPPFYTPRPAPACNGTPNGTNRGGERFAFMNQLRYEEEER